MGWGAPAAVAAKIERPEKRVTCLAGDGGFAMTMPALMTAVQQDRPVVVVVSNNKGLGIVRDNLGDCNIGADFGDVDFARIAEAWAAAACASTAATACGTPWRRRTRTAAASSSTS